MSPKSVLTCQAVSRHFDLIGETVDVLNDIDFNVEQGQMVAIVGTSGSGKTTLLNLLAGLDDPSSGSIEMVQQDFSQLSDKKRANLRNQHMGFVFQFHHLLPEFSALDNVLMPWRIHGKVSPEARQYAEELLTLVGLGERMRHRPAEMSGGERQRVAIARALVKNPDVVLMDEPTGNLDESTSESIQQLIETLNRDLSVSFVIVTHNQEWANRLPNQYRLTKGHLTKIC